MGGVQPFLGETNDRERAFPGIAELELTVVQDKFGHYTARESQRQSRYTKATIPRRLGCLNPRCQQGGLDLQQIVMFWSEGQHKFFCNGHEGTPNGRRKGDPCDNMFELTLSIKRNNRGG